MYSDRENERECEMDNKREKRNYKDTTNMRTASMYRMIQSITSFVIDEVLQLIYRFVKLLILWKSPKINSNVCVVAVLRLIIMNSKC